MTALSSEQLLQFLLAIGLMLFAGKLFGELFRKIKQAAVVGEIIAGILLGPTLFGVLSPETFDWIFPSSGPVSYSIDGLTTLSIIFLLLAVGLEVDLSVLIKFGRAAIKTTFLSMLIPFILGFLGGYLLTPVFNLSGSNQLLFSLFLGMAFSISALPIIARTLLDLGIFKSNLGMMIIASAMFNDLLGWIGFSILLSVAESQKAGPPLIIAIPLILLFSFLMIFVLRRIISKAVFWIQNNFSWPGGILGFIITFGLAGSIITEKLGVHSILGAFIVGVAIGDSVHLEARTREIIQQFITHIFAPLFFVNIGLHFNFIQSFDLMIVLIVVGLGFIGKIVGAGIGARWGGFSSAESLAAAFALNSRGVLEIILAIFALKLNLINAEIFEAVIVLVVLSSIISGPAIKIILNKRTHLKKN